MGKLVYLMGPSGAGKDSLLAALREKNLPGILVAHRYITRSFNAGGENHIALSELEFQQRKAADCFLFDWESHGYCYGIGREVLDWMGKGFVVLVNGSREYLGTALDRYPGLIPILVTVSPHVLRQRLVQRGRESMAEIEKRLNRFNESGNDFPRGTRVIHNDTSLEQAVEALCCSLP